MDSSQENIDYRKGTIGAVQMHDAVRRENALQQGGEGRIGISVIVVSVIILIIGGGQLFQTLSPNGSGFGSSIYITKNYTPAPRPALGAEDETGADVAWIDEWTADGKKVYSNCIACHQASGLGLPGQFPPLVGSEWVNGGTKRLGAILLHGINGPLKVGGQSYNQLMPPWNQLSDEKLAQVITYVRREFGSLPEGEDGVVTTEMIKAAREEFSGKATTFTESELLAIPGEENLPGAKVDLQTGEPVGGS